VQQLLAERSSEVLIKCVESEGRPPDLQAAAAFI
jgi:hypothetical protein